MQKDTAPDLPFLVQCSAIGLLSLSISLALALLGPSGTTDTREALAYGHFLTLATPKQPPMMQWLGWLVVHLAYPTNFYAVLLTQILNLAGLAYLLGVLRTVTDHKQAVVWVMLFAGSGYIVLDPLTTALGADVIQFPFWAALLFHGMRATQRQSLIHWLAFALACSGAFYTKYTALLFLFSLGLASVVVPEYRILWRDRGFYIAVVLFCILISPHLLAAAHTPSASEYAIERFELDRSMAVRAHDLGQIALGFVLFLLPPWITVSALVWSKGAALATNKGPVARFVRVATIASLAVLAILVAGGLSFPFRYDAPYVFLAPVLAATCIRFDTPKWRIAKRWIMGVAVFAPLVTLIFGVLSDSVFGHHFLLQEPTAEAAREIGAEWARRYSCGPAYIVGDTRSAYGLAINWSPPLPGVPFERMDYTPWYDPSLREKLGVVIVFHDKIDENEVHRFFPEWKLPPAASLSLPFVRTLSHSDPQTYAYLFVPPKDCSGRPTM